MIESRIRSRLHYCKKLAEQGGLNAFDDALLDEGMHTARYSLGELHHLNFDEPLLSEQVYRDMIEFHPFEDRFCTHFVCCLVIRLWI